jgi:hypothetical protein
MNELVINEQQIQNRIYAIQDIQFMLDSDLATMYGVETKRINEAVKNNPDKFPSDFYFELTKEDDETLRSKFSTFNESLKSRKYAPKVFTEQGVYMLATVLKSKTATEITLAIIRTFAQMRRVLHDNTLLQAQVKEMEKRQLSYEIKTDEKLQTIFDAIESKDLKPSQGIFYDGQIFDAYAFVSELIKSAKNSITLFDNYVDESVLTLLSKNQTAAITIYTKTITKQLQLDLQKYNSQYSPIEIKKFDLSHDRFLLIDDCVYHIGASLKDLGKKWFGFSKMDKNSFEMMGRVN